MCVIVDDALDDNTMRSTFTITMEKNLLWRKVYIQYSYKSFVYLTYTNNTEDEDVVLIENCGCTVITITVLLLFGSIFTIGGG